MWRCVLGQLDQRLPVEKGSSRRHTNCCSRGPSGNTAYDRIKDSCLAEAGHCSMPEWSLHSSGSDWPSASVLKILPAHSLALSRAAFQSPIENAPEYPWSRPHRSSSDMCIPLS
jgi:hypothetical protein